MKIQLKHSNALSSGIAIEPLPSNLENGEIAVNYSANDPSIFIRDDNNNIRKLSIVELSLVQSDWDETDPAVPSYIQNKDTVYNLLDNIELELNSKVDHADPNGILYGSKNGGWTPIPVLEANQNGIQYVRKDGDWEPLDVSGILDAYYTNTEIDNLIALSLTAAQLYTDNEIADLDDIYLRDANGSINNDSKFYCRSNGSWFEFDPSGQGDGDLSNYVTKTEFNQTLGSYVDTFSSQNVGGTKSFNGQVNLNSRMYVSSGSVWFNGRDRLEPVGDGFRITRDGNGGSGGSGSSPGTGGMSIKFQDNASNVKVGIRNGDASVALEVNSTLRANQFQRRDGNNWVPVTRSANPERTSTFDGLVFIADGGMDFKSPVRFNHDIISTGGNFSRVDDTPSAALLSISAAERTVATSLRSALRGYIRDGVRKFTVDKETLVNAFSSNGLDIANYGIMQEIEIPPHSGFEDPDINLSEPRQQPASYTAVDYQSLFAFMLAAGPDLSALEARITALENA